MFGLLLFDLFIGLLLVNLFIKNTNGSEFGNNDNNDSIRRIERMIDLISNNGNNDGNNDGDKKKRRLTSFAIYEFGIYSSDLASDILSDRWELINIDDLNDDLFDLFIESYNANNGLIAIRDFVPVNVVLQVMIGMYMVHIN